VGEKSDQKKGNGQKRNLAQFIRETHHDDGDQIGPTSERRSGHRRASSIRGRGIFTGTLSGRESIAASWGGGVGLLGGGGGGGGWGGGGVVGVVFLCGGG